MSNEHCWVYLLTTRNHKMFYTGFTNDLCRRIWEHKNNIYIGFTFRYSVKKLVYFEEFDDYDQALFREKQIKRYKRNWKQHLVDQFNPKWEDLYNAICGGSS
ncbi:MAG: GIY-YIG nuclease family protein [Cyclobacteriaceae bacterium]|nr:GIY-YIG nuclease family protein [Cyclobacteriaceae bacterium]